METPPVGIDPKIDCVFRALLASERHKALLLDFLNAVLTPKDPIVDAEILNPFNFANYVGDNITIVDVKARDSSGRVFQVEMQSANEGGLKPRILYTWSDNYQEQLRSGGEYTELRPVISIWILGENIFRYSPDFHHHFEVIDLPHRLRLTDHLSIHTLELRKWLHTEALDPVGKWMYFFKEAERWSELPPEADSPALREAMTILKDFKDRAELRSLYLSRLDQIRRQRTQEKERERLLEEQKRITQEREAALALAEQEKAAKEVALTLAEQERQEKEKEKAERERLREMLLKVGIDPEKA